MTRPIPSTTAGRRLFSDVEPMDMWESDGVTPADIVAVEQEAGELGAAWAEAEAALPGGYALMLRGSANWANRGPVWKVSAYHSDGRRKAWQADGPTPVAALLALAAKLRETT